MCENKKEECGFCDEEYTKDNPRYNCSDCSMSGHKRCIEQPGLEGVKSEFLPPDGVCIHCGQALMIS